MANGVRVCTKSFNFRSFVKIKFVTLYNIYSLFLANVVKSVVKKRANKLIVGKSSVKQEVKAVSTTRNVDVFVSRLHPETQSDDLECCVKYTKTDFAIIDITCNKLQSKYEELYVSFHVSIKVDSADMSQAVKVFMSPDTWPCGVFVKRFFKRKDD